VRISNTKKIPNCYTLEQVCYTSTSLSLTNKNAKFVSQKSVMGFQIPPPSLIWVRL